MIRHVYLPVLAEIAGLTWAVVAFGALLVLLVLGPHLELLLVVVPAGAGLLRWADMFRRPKVAPRRRRELLAAAIELAPHWFERPRRPAHRLYGTFVEATGERVMIALVSREPGAKHVTIIERRHHCGDEVEAAAATVAAIDERAAELERKVREREEAELVAADQERRRRELEADEARLREIDERHAAELAAREARLRSEDEQARHREAELEAESLARALRREP